MNLIHTRILVFAALSVKLTLASAHAPVVETTDSSPENPITITWSLDISIAIYGHFEHTHDVDVVDFNLTDQEAADGVNLYLHTLVPACRVYQKLLPTVAVVGPWQGSLRDSGTAVDLPFEPAHGEGLTLLKNSEQGQTWYEPFSGKNYFWQKSMTVTLSRAGRYRLYLWSPQQMRGDYVLAIGSRERWGLREISRAFRHMPELLSNREIHNESCRAELERQEPSTNPLPEK